MKEEELHKELASIRNIMERSSKFISLSGLSGVLAGIYALIGAVIAYFIIRHNSDAHGFFTAIWRYINVLLYLSAIAVAVLLLSVVTGIILSVRKAHKRGESIWNKTSKLLLFNVAVPLVTGGIMVVILLYNAGIGFIVPAMLIFYGLALFNAANFTYSDVKYLGIIDIVLGLITACFPKYGLYAWALGFGVMHIIYGSIMYLKYDR